MYLCSDPEGVSIREFFAKDMFMYCPEDSLLEYRNSIADTLRGILGKLLTHHNIHILGLLFLDKDAGMGIFFPRYAAFVKKKEVSEQRPGSGGTRPQLFIASKFKSLFLTPLFTRNSCRFSLPCLYDFSKLRRVFKGPSFCVPIE